MQFFNLIRKSVLPISGASSIEAYGGKLFVVGDDSPTLYVTDSSWKSEENIVLIPEKRGRIPKMEKMDLEASTIIDNNGAKSLFILGSASMPGREVAIVAPVKNLHDFVKYDCSIFFNRLRQQFGLKSVNIEGVANVENRYLIIACRSSKTNPQNYLFATPTDFFKKQLSSYIEMVRLDLPENIGISGLSFIWGQNKAIFTATVENSPDSIQDGEIGDSYFGYINMPVINPAHYHRAKRPAVIPAWIGNLNSYSRAFWGEKVESVAIVERYQNSRIRKYTLNFVSDNDNGVSHIFEVELNLPPCKS